MDEKCTHQFCYAPDSTCNIGELELKDCKYWKGTQKRRTELMPTADTDGSRRLPWSGNRFGTVDLEFIAGRSRPRVIAVGGSVNAGKTTLLTFIYLLLCRGQKLESGRFAGSFTLGGWESLARSLRWQDGLGPEFPQHTIWRTHQDTDFCLALHSAEC